MADGGGEGEHVVQMMAGGSGPGKVAAPEKWLNRFVRAVVLIERVGNALGTLAFTWATVVLLGGYANSLVVRALGLFVFRSSGYPSSDVFFRMLRFLSRSRTLAAPCLAPPSPASLPRRRPPSTSSPALATSSLAPGPLLPRRVAPACARPRPTPSPPVAVLPPRARPRPAVAASRLPAPPCAFPCSAAAGHRLPAPCRP
nr:uncharacterized protein LOC120973555 [Aegilops tauschii subsp. strangulata]